MFLFKFHLYLFATYKLTINQAFTWTNAGLLLAEMLQTNFSGNVQKLSCLFFKGPIDTKSALNQS